MPGRHQLVPLKRSRLRWITASFGALVAVGVVPMFGTAASASTPNPTYHPGSDTATFTVTGVLDSNCLVSAGGTEIWIKPGDKIDFNSSVVGINVNGLLSGLNALLGSVAGLNVSATIDPGTTHSQSVSVAGGKSTIYPGAAQPALTAGDHRIQWTATSLALLPNILGKTSVPLSVSALKSGASLSWTGVIHVTQDAAKCKIGVGTPQVGISVGPVKVTVPPVNVSVPQPSVPNVKLPSLPGVTLPGGSGGTSTGGAGGGSSDSGNGLPVPARVVPKGDGNAVFGNVGSGYFPGVLPGSSSLAGGSGQLLPVAAGSGKATSAVLPQQNSSGKHKTIDLASSKATQPTGQFSVILAIIAIIALSVVAATYARLYLLRRES